MRGSAWAVPLVATVLWVAAIGWPLAAGIELTLSEQRSSVEIRHSRELLLVSGAWAAAAALGAMILGWAPGRVLGKSLSRRSYGLLAVLMLAPICLPSYVVFFAWWQAWPADTWLYRWAVEHGQVQLVRQATLLAGFLCWSWPIVAWCVAGSVAATPAQREELLLIDGARWWERLRDRLRCDGRGLAVGGLIVFLATFNNTTSFDLAEIFTFGNELRAVEALGATDRDVLAAALPPTVLTALGAAGIWFLLGLGSHGIASRSRRISRSALALTAVIWLVSVAIPLALLARNLRAGAGQRGLKAQLDEFTMFYGQGMLNTMLIALCVAGVAVTVTVGLAWMWQDRRPWVRWLAHGQAVGWIIAAAVPGTMVGVALRGAYNRGVLADIVYTQPSVLVLGHLARFGFLAALLGRWMAMSEPRSLVDLRMLDGADRLGGLLRATWPRMLAASAATFAVVLVLSLGEIPVTAAVRPAGFDAITTSILNDMHFQRPQTVMIATAIFMIFALIAAAVACTSWMVMRRRGAGAAVRVASLLLMATLLVGCTDADERGEPLRPVNVFGTAGIGLGQFSYPRALAIDREREYLYVVDKTARIQRFDLDGKPQLSWSMPEFAMGKPTGITVADDGSVWLADTHYFRVMAFDSQGKELMRFGSYGTEPGQFIYTTGVAFGPEGRIYVSEAGGNDRVQVFDAEGNYLFHFGSFGSGSDQFNRPQSLAFNHDRTELFIADACNHRIVVTDPQGDVLRILGRPGRGAGELSYPYDIMVLPDDSLLVCEYHNCRIQRLTPEGRALEIYGRAGRGRGEVQFPWGVDGTDQMLYVLDSGNNRVQVVRTP